MNSEVSSIPFMKNLYFLSLYNKFKRNYWDYLKERYLKKKHFLLKEKERLTWLKKKGYIIKKPSKIRLRFLKKRKNLLKKKPDINKKQKFLVLIIRNFIIKFVKKFDTIKNFIETYTLNLVIL